MAFGQQSGPPATARQVQELLGLLHDAGHVDFRDARGPMGFTQRQAAGKFTRDEADAFIEQLQEAESAEAEPVEGAPPTRPAARSVATRPPGRPSAAEQALRKVPAEQLAAELQRRGWVVMEP
ncbi:MAG TPA: hypothetical protein VGO78_25390 [Acidimicrobiales bacterium]|jgi:hypothetical protein|nr:hypothetical protein [Acidimicrobiales bacterium]